MFMLHHLRHAVFLCLLPLIVSGCGGLQEVWEGPGARMFRPQAIAVLPPMASQYDNAREDIQEVLSGALTAARRRHRRPCDVALLLLEHARELAHDPVARRLRCGAGPHRVFEIIGERAPRRHVAGYGSTRAPWLRLRRLSSGGLPGRVRAGPGYRQVFRYRARLQLLDERYRDIGPRVRRNRDRAQRRLPVAGQGARPRNLGQIRFTPPPSPDRVPVRAMARYVAGILGYTLRTVDLEPLRALQPHSPADGKAGVGVVEPGEDVHGDRPLQHRGDCVEVVEPSDPRVASPRDSQRRARMR